MTIYLLSKGTCISAVHLSWRNAKSSWPGWRTCIHQTFGFHLWSSCLVRAKQGLWCLILYQFSLAEQQGNYKWISFPIAWRNVGRLSGAKVFSKIDYNRGSSKFQSAMEAFTKQHLKLSGGLFQRLVISLCNNAPVSCPTIGLGPSACTNDSSDEDLYARHMLGGCEKIRRYLK